MAESLESQDMQVLPSSTPLRLSSTGLLPFLDISPDALVIINAAGMIVMANGQTAAIFGYPLEELLGQPLEMLLPQRFHEIHTLHRERYFTSPRARPMGVGLQLLGRREDGTEFPVDISLRPLLLDDVLHAIGAIRDVTGERLVERERVQQLQHIRLQTELINLAHDAILVRDPINRVLSWNRGAEELYGWTAQDALGRVSHTLLKTRFPIRRSALEAYLEQEGRWEGQLTHTRRDGSAVIVESRQVLVRDETGQAQAILEIDRDITERRRLERAEQAVHADTAERLAFLQQVLDALPSSVYLVYGSDARLMLANQAASRVWGAQWPANQPMLEFLASNGIEIADTQGRPLPSSEFATLRAVQRGENVLQHQEMIHHPGGSSLPVLVSAVTLPSRHSLLAPRKKRGRQSPSAEPVALVINQDVTALKEAEYLKDEFIGIAAHELRTPLAALAGFADMLTVQTARGHGPALADWQQEALQEIKEATGRLVTLTEDLLDVTRLQAGQLILQRAPTNVVPLVQRVAARMQQMTTRHHVAVRATPTVLVADIDTRRIEQVLNNLIGNAMKYSPRGGPVTITIWEETADQAVRISVQDTGIGIPEHQHAQIFGRFMRAENAQARGISGTGLGLYLCRELVEWHGGHLWFESQEGVGSTFFVTLPLYE
jgi:PAS domain S-box-containing protein